MKAPPTERATVRRLRSRIGKLQQTLKDERTAHARTKDFLVEKRDRIHFLEDLVRNLSRWPQ